MKYLLLISLVIMSSNFAYAEDNVELYKKKAFLTLSAFECAIVAPDDSETERLFTIGLNVGRDFIEFVKNNTDLYLKTLKSQVPILWSMTSGPTPDFILGQIYANRAEKIYEEFPTDKELWKLTKGNMYRKQNCALLSDK